MTSKFIVFLVTTLFAFLFPLILFIVWRKKTNCKWIAFIVGAICFTVFANGLESVVHYYFLSTNEITLTFFTNHLGLYALYGGLMAGLFEETGRLLGFKLLLSKYKTKETAIGYGIGHAGIECVLTLGVTYLLYALVLGGMSLGDGQTNSIILQSIDQINAGLASVAMLERLIATSVHIGLSILVFKAANVKGCFYLYPVAILLHMITDIPAALYQTGFISSIFAVEGITLIIGLAILYIGIKVYKTLENKGEQNEQSN